MALEPSVTRRFAPGLLLGRCAENSTHRPLAEGELNAKLTRMLLSTRCPPRESVLRTPIYEPWRPKPTRRPDRWRKDLPPHGGSRRHKWVFPQIGKADKTFCNLLQVRCRWPAAPGWPGRASRWRCDVGGICSPRRIAPGSARLPKGDADMRHLARRAPADFDTGRDTDG